MTPDHTEAKEPEPEPVAGCLGICCHLHDKCEWYYAVDGLTTGRVIDTCGIGVDKPMYKVVGNAEITGTPGIVISTAGLAVVYGSDDNWFFSDGVTRDFGQNKVVKLIDGETVFCSVQPLKCEPLACGLRIVGTINRDG